jgi:hypothetical protein
MWHRAADQRAYLPHASLADRGIRLADSGRTLSGWLGLPSRLGPTVVSGTFFSPENKIKLHNQAELVHYKYHNLTGICSLS